MLGAVGLSGWVATMSIEAPTDGEVFRAYLQHVLCPKLKPGQVVVMDNLSAHKVEGVRELIRSTGARLRYLPPYSPDLNPIEMCWAQLKQHLRAAKARSVAALERALDVALQALIPEQAAACYRKALDVVRQRPDDYDAAFDQKFVNLIAKLDPPAAAT